MVARMMNIKTPLSMNLENFPQWSTVIRLQHFYECAPGKISEYRSEVHHITEVYDTYQRHRIIKLQNFN